MTQNIKDLVGKTFNRLTVLEKLPTTKGPSKYLCVCSCGNQTVVRGGSLTEGNTMSCGCLKAERLNEANTTHGMCYSPEFNAWAKMWGRTTKPKNKNYNLYKDRKPPEIWKDFEVFFAELGPKPSPKHSLDRINNDLPYGPGNCRWATNSEQHNNTSANITLTYLGESKTAAQWAREFGMRPQTLYSRLKRGFSVEDALTKPTRTQGNL